MKTAEEIIRVIQKLPPEEWQKVREFMDAEEEYVETCYSKEEMEDIRNDVEEAENGINISGTFANANEAVAHLRSLSKLS